MSRVKTSFTQILALQLEKREKQRKKSKEPEIGGEKSKQAIKVNKIDDDDDTIDNSNCESIENIGINNNAIIELCYYYKMSKLSLDDCILCYDKINQNINSCDHVNFLSLLHYPVKLKTIEEILLQIINKK